MKPFSDEYPEWIVDNTMTPLHKNMVAISPYNPLTQQILTGITLITSRDEAKELYNCTKQLVKK